MQISRKTTVLTEAIYSAVGTFIVAWMLLAAIILWDQRLTLAAFVIGVSWLVGLGIINYLFYAFRERN